MSESTIVFLGPEGQTPLIETTSGRLSDWLRRSLRRYTSESEFKVQGAVIDELIARGVADAVRTALESTL